MAKAKRKKRSGEAKSIPKGYLLLNETKVKPILQDMQRQLEILENSLGAANVSINKLVNQKVVTGNRATAYKSVSKKAKSQATAASKLKTMLMEKYEEDLQFYPLQLLDVRIAELEKKIASLVEE